MKFICAWCQAETKPPDGKNDEITSHGICAKCKLAEFGATLVFIEEIHKRDQIQRKTGIRPGAT